MVERVVLAFAFLYTLSMIFKMSVGVPKLKIGMDSSFIRGGDRFSFLFFDVDLVPLS